MITAAAVIRQTDRALRPVARMQAEHFAMQTTNEIIADTVAAYIDGSQCTYDDFAAILYDENGRVSTDEALPSGINRVQSDLTRLINNQLENGMSSPSYIPIGSLTDSYMLAGKGPRLKIRVCPAREASVKLVSSFDSAGMNQTRHRITAVIHVSLTSSLPLYSFDTEADFEFLIAENIIVGSVPFS